MLNINLFGMTVAVVLALQAGSCSSVASNTKDNVPLTDFFGRKPTVQIEWPNLLLTVPTNYPSSVAYISPTVKIEGSNVLIEGKYVLRKKPATTTFNLIKLGMTKEVASSAKAFWVNPDGTKKELAIESKRPGEK